MRLLSVDWDYFFPVPWGSSRPRLPGELSLYDWGHRESIFHTFDVWPIRGWAFLARNWELPLCQDYAGFWDHFDFSSECQMFLSDSHVFAADQGVLDGVTEVWNYDAHHDCGYGDMNTLFRAVAIEGRVDCGNWGFHAHWANMIDNWNQRYPAWKDRALQAESPPTWANAKIVGSRKRKPDYPEGAIGKIFLCRSSAWVPPWCDAEFERFFQACPAVLNQQQVFDKPSDPRIPRQFSDELVAFTERMEGMLP